MTRAGLLGASILCLGWAQAAQAQTTAVEPQTEDTAANEGEIIVTAQRQSQALQDVPIAISAFTADALDKQQIENSSDLQLSLPNITFTKTNFTSSSFTIRGIGDLCTGASCDQATAIHLNGSPLINTRLFETEFYDLERIEVLRGPQGTLFGRNATSGVVNLITAKPKVSKNEAAGEIEYGNFDALKLKGMINIGLGDVVGARLAGFYLRRDGYTRNTFDGTRIDDRDMYGLRGSLRFEPSDTTTIDLMGSYFREKDNRSRIQKQLCERDPLGVLGCLPNRLLNEPTNANALFTGTLTSREFLSLQGIPTAFGLGSLYGTDAYAGVVVPTDRRTVTTDTTPTYFTEEKQFQARLEQGFGNMTLQLTGMYNDAVVDSTTDYNLTVANRAVLQPGLNVLAGAAAGLIPGLPAGPFQPIAAALIPGGPGGELCTSAPEPTGTGAYGGNRVCGATPLDFDRSYQKNRAWSAEAILTSDFDGAFNFLVGGIYLDSRVSENSYYVNAFPIDYLSGILGTFQSFPNGLPPSYLGTPFFRNFTDDLRLKSYGLFGEAYVEATDRLKLTVGLRYNNDKKRVAARSTLASFLVPFGTPGAFQSPLGARFDGDPSTPCPPGSPLGQPGSVAGCEALQIKSTNDDAWTGRAVVDYKLSDDSLIYASFSRGYKSGGINPPLQPIFAVPEFFAAERIDAYEVGTKNNLFDNRLTLNLTGFLYNYSNLQLARIVARTSVNDNVDARIWGLEAEAVVRPDPALAINLSASYLKTKVTEDRFLVDQRDPSGGRADAVIIKDISNGANCAVVPTTAGNAAGANAFVGAVNQLLNAVTLSGTTFVPRTAANPNGAPLRGPAAFPANSGLSATGAFSLCSVLQAAAAGGIPQIPTAAFGGVQVLSPGVEVNLRGNPLPQAPTYKLAAGAQYTHELPNGAQIVPRVDLSYTGESTASIFDGRADQLQGYTIVNAQVQFNGPQDRWYARAFVQNLFDSNAITGQYLTDASSGLFTNIFTLEPRRYGAAVGFRF